MRRGARPISIGSISNRKRAVGNRAVSAWLALVIAISHMLFFVHTAPSWAATIAASTCSRADVGTAVNSAGDGDTVMIPPGDCTWTSELTVQKGINLLGAGANSTTIRDNVAKNGSTTSHLITFSVNSPSSFRIANFTLVGQAVDASNFNYGHIGISGTSKSFRVDHITLNNPQTSFVRAVGDLWGLIDHIAINGNGSILQAGMSNWGGSNYGDGSWAEQLYLGTVKAIYVEDCTVVANGNPFATNTLDGLDGARVVFRYNNLTQGNTTAHGTDSGQRRRSIRSQEIYNNTYNFPPGMAVDFIAWFRGGTGVMYNNTINVPGGLNNVAKHQNQRDSQSFNPWGQCNGSSPYDQNQAGQSGYICVDQPGSGTSVNLQGSSSPAATGNISDPIYVWNNTVNGAPDNCGTFGCQDDGHVKAGRDIIFQTARPGYTAFTYPHPLQSGIGTSNAPPAPPQNLTVR